MLTINRKTDYASRIILHLALQSSGSRTTAREVAKLRLIPPALVRRIVTQLGRAGLITTVRGTNGGFTLARPPSQINLLDVVEAMEGTLALNPCTVDPQFCPLMPTCTVHQVWVKARQVLRDELSRATFDQLAQAEGGEAL